MPNQTSLITKTTLLLVSCLTIMSIITISPALPLMAESFSSEKGSEFMVKLILTIPALFIAVMAPLAGRLIDKRGRLKYLWLALITYALAGSAGFYLQSLTAILVSRILLGISVGITMTIVVTLVADYFEGAERQNFVGIQVAFMSLAGILFIGLGGILADINWRYPFLIYLFALLVLPFALRYLTEPESVVEEALSESPAVKLPSLIWLLFINTMVMWILFFLIPVQIPFHLKAIGVESNALIGAAIAMGTASSAVFSFSYSRLKDRISFTAIFSIGYLLMALGFSLIAFSEVYFHVLIAMVLCGGGLGMMIPNTNMWVMKIAPPSIRGKAIGQLTTFWFLGQFLTPVIILPLVSNLSNSAIFYVAAGILGCLSVCFGLLQLAGIEKEPKLRHS